MTGGYFICRKLSKQEIDGVVVGVFRYRFQAKEEETLPDIPIVDVISTESYLFTFLCV